jgi:hypothetical protein
MYDGCQINRQIVGYKNLCPMTVYSRRTQEAVGHNTAVGELCFYCCACTETEDNDTYFSSNPKDDVM